MQTLFPHLPFDPTETQISYASRLAVFHLGGGLMSFLHNVGITADDLKTGTNGAIEALCAKAGADAAQVLSNTALRMAKRQYSLRGHEVSAEFLSSPNTNTARSAFWRTIRKTGGARGVVPN